MKCFNNRRDTVLVGSIRNLGDWVVIRDEDRVVVLQDTRLPFMGTEYRLLCDCGFSELRRYRETSVYDPNREIKLISWVKGIPSSLPHEKVTLIHEITGCTGLLIRGNNIISISRDAKILDPQSLRIIASGLGLGYEPLF